MSWHSDREPFDEYDPPYCENCRRGDSYEECAACERMHNKAGEGEEGRISIATQHTECVGNALGALEGETE